MPALLLIDPTPDTVNYLILGYIFLIGLPVLYVLSWYARQRSLKRDLETIETLAADERKRTARPVASSAPVAPSAPVTSSAPAAANGPADLTPKVDKPQAR